MVLQDQHRKLARAGVILGHKRNHDFHQLYLTRAMLMAGDRIP